MSPPFGGILDWQSSWLALLLLRFEGSRKILAKRTLVEILSEVVRETLRASQFEALKRFALETFV